MLHVLNGDDEEGVPALVGRDDVWGVFSDNTCPIGVQGSRGDLSLA